VAVHSVLVRVSESTEGEEVGPGLGLHPRQYGVPDNDLSGRSIIVRNFPKGCIWFLLKTLGDERSR